MSRRAAALVVALGLAVATAAGCQPGGDREPRVVTETRFLDRLSGAIDGLNGARDLLAADANAIGRAAALIDDVDDAAVTGSRQAVRPVRAKANAATPKAGRAARSLNGDIRAYRDAITALAEAPTEGLDAPQRAAVAEVVKAARAELAQLRSYATVVAAVWPRYEKLDEDQKLWLMRASNGWYRDQQEAAGNYAVMTDRAALAKDRRSLAAADARRLAAAKAAGAAMADARAALAALLG